MVTMPRGLGSLVAMFLVGRLINRFDARLIIAVGLALSVYGLNMMSHFSLGMDSSLIIWSGLVQGLGIGLIFVPLTTLGFATLDSRYRADGAGVFTLMRNLGSSAGISIMQALHTQNLEKVHARLVAGLTPGPGKPPLPSPFSYTDPTGLAALNGEVNRQASMVAYIDDFKLMSILAIVLIPALLFLRGAPKTKPAHDLLVE